MLSTKMVAHTFMDDIDWFVWESVDDAHIWRQDGSLEHITSADLNDVVFPASKTRQGGDLIVSAPVGRFRSISIDVRVPSPATRGQILRAIHAFYQRPVTSDIMKMMRAAGATDCDYFRDVETRLNDGRNATLLDLCGSAQYLMSVIMGKAKQEGSPAGAKKFRRHPLGDCSGAVRFEGLSGDDRTCRYDMFIGS